MTLSSELASRLWQARQDGIPVPRNAGDFLSSVQEAYQVQAETIKLAKLDSIGWKVGATSEAVQKMVGVDAPAPACMFADRCYDNGATVPIFDTFEIGLECEFAFRFADALPTRSAPYKREEVLSAVDSVVPALELVGTRFEGGLAGLGAMHLIADMAVHSAWVKGDETQNWRQFNLKDHPIRLFQNDALVAQGLGENALGDPLNVLEWLANHLSALGTGVKAGDVISTGTCTGVVSVAPGDTFVADFADLGAVRMRCSSQV